MKTNEFCVKHAQKLVASIRAEFELWEEEEEEALKEAVSNVKTDLELLDTSLLILETKLLGAQI